jgi:hypothetical protein
MRGNEGSQGPVLRLQPSPGGVLARRQGAPAPYSATSRTPYRLRRRPPALPARRMATRTHQIAKALGIKDHPGATVDHVQGPLSVLASAPTGAVLLPPAIMPPSPPRISRNGTEDAPYAVKWPVQRRNLGRRCAWGRARTPPVQGPRAQDPATMTTIIPRPKLAMAPLRP